MSSVANTNPVPLALPFRLRTVLFLLLVGLFVVVTLPRVRAAWRLRGLVTRVAEYGLCMAGPTGAIAIRDDVIQFRSLVRRRLVGATATDRPFMRCGALASAITGRPDVALGHAEPAADFIEWGGGGRRQSINAFMTVLPDLETLHRQSWPLFRKPLAELLRPTRGAFEAVHPTDLAEATPVRGLVLDGAIVRSTLESPKWNYLVQSNDRESWAMRSRDQGRSWIATSVWQSALDGHAAHCVGDATGTRFALAPERAGANPAILHGTMTALSGERHEFGMPNDQVLRLACDDSGAVVLTRRPKELAHHVYACPTAAACREVTLPPLARAPGVALDVGRLARTVVVVLSKEGLIRVTTSRDEGATMTPLSLVFDARDGKNPGIPANLLPTLLGFGKRLQLVLSAQGRAERWAIGSDDLGASFHSL